MTEPQQQSDLTSPDDSALVIQRTPPQELKALLQMAASGSQINPSQHHILASVIRAVAEHEPGVIASIAIKQQMYSGPLPHFEQLNGYDEDTRRKIVQMALDEQAHAHYMQRSGLKGAIWKDRTAQFCALTIALAGLGAAAWISQYSGLAAGIIGSVDLLGIVCAFVAPRVLESVAKKRKAEPPAKPKSKQRKR